MACRCSLKSRIGRHDPFQCVWRSGNTASLRCSLIGLAYRASVLGYWHSPSLCLPAILAIALYSSNFVIQLLSSSDLLNQSHRVLWVDQLSIHEVPRSSTVCPNYPCIHAYFIEDIHTAIRPALIQAPSLGESELR
jgi:hypothetical protein